jgi:multicomponent Na+:H+ antiporter subunit C
MQAWLHIPIGLLFATGLYCMLRRSIVRTIFGLALLSHAAHLLILASSGSPAGTAPLIAHDADRLAPPFADPLPQALILTAIVINFGLTAFLVALVVRTRRAIGSDDVDEMVESER